MTRICCGLLTPVIAALLAFQPQQDRSVSDSFRAFSTAWQAAQAAEARGDWVGAVSQYQKVLEVLPYEPSARFQLACGYAQLKRVDEAFDALALAVEFGWSDAARIEGAEEFAALRDDPRFRKMAAAAKACKQERFLFYSGRGLNPEKPAPLLVYLSGLGPGPRAELPYWKPVADELGLILVGLRGTTEISPLLHAWQRAEARDSTQADFYDLIAARQRVADAVGAARQKFNVDRERCFLSGFSQGGGVALALLAANPEGFRGAVAVAALVPPLGGKVWETAQWATRPRIALEVGEYDRLQPRNEELADRLRRAGVSVRFEVWPKSGHEYPPDSTRFLTAAVRFVMGANEQ